MNHQPPSNVKRVRQRRELHRLALSMGLSGCFLATLAATDISGAADGKPGDAVAASRSYRAGHQVEILQEYAEILSIPKDLPGDVVECGCYNGASTATLSLACYLTNRRLMVCDSFEGPPEPKDEEEFDYFPNSNEYYQWKGGEFKSEGGLEGVKNTVAKHGHLEVCEFVVGYFPATP